MFIDKLLLLLSILSGITLSNVIGQTSVPICDFEASSLCALEARDLALINGCQISLVIPPLEECISNNTNGCDETEQIYWQTFISTFRQDLQQQCYSGTYCGDSLLQGQIDDCLDLFGGIESLAYDIVTYNFGPMNTSCYETLPEIMECIENVTVSCSTLEDSTREYLRQYETAFIQCNIPLDDIITTIEPITITDIPDTENEASRTALIAAVAASGFVVILAGSMIVGIWMKSQRDANFMKPQSQTNGKLEKAREIDSESYFTRGSLRHSRRHENNDRQSEFSMGPYRATDRWWTKPDFGTYGYQAKPARPF